MTTSLAIRDGSDGCTLPVRVHPGARRNAIDGVHDGALKVSLTTPPTDGRANQALIAFLAGELHVPRQPRPTHCGMISAAATNRLGCGKSSRADENRTSGAKAPLQTGYLRHG